MPNVSRRSFLVMAADAKVDVALGVTLNAWTLGGTGVT